MKFGYFVGTELDENIFIRTPKILFKSKLFKGLGSEGRLLYSLMLDRMQLSSNNKSRFKEPDGRVFIYYSIESIMEELEVGRNKVFDILKKMEDDYGLIVREKQGQGKPTKIFVMKIVVEEGDMEVDHESENQTSDENMAFSEVPKSNFLKFENQTSRVPKSNTQEVYSEDSINNNINNTEFTNKSILITSPSTEMRKDMEAYSEIVRENLCIDVLKDRDPVNAEDYEAIYDLVLETVLNKNPDIVIAGNKYPSELVKGKFLKLNQMHVEYVMDCMHSNTTKVRNIKKYMLAALFNAPSTMPSYYRAETNHDLYGVG